MCDVQRTACPFFKNNVQRAACPFSKSWGKSYTGQAVRCTVFHNLLAGCTGYLPLAKLKFLSRFWLAVLFALNHSVITGKKSVLFQNAMKAFIQIVQCTGYCQ